VSDGLKVIHALVLEGGRARLRRLNRDLFLQEELPAYELFIEHYRQYGQIPSVEVFMRAGIGLPAVQSGFDYYLDECRKRAIWNAAREHASQVGTLLHGGRTGENVDQLVTLSRDLSVQIGRIHAQENVQTLALAASDVVEDYQNAHARAGLRGIPMGWPTLDDLTAGAQPGDLIIWVARRNIGKTYLAVRNALAAWDDGCRVLFVSMEMPVDQVARRIVGMRAALNPDLIRRGTLSDDAFLHLQEAVAGMQVQAANRSPFWLLQGNLRKDTGLIDSIVQEFRPDIVVIDGSYLLKPVEKGISARWEKQSAIHEELKTIALARDLPIAAPVQESRAGKQSKSGDGIVAGSDVIEQLASVMIRPREGLGEHQNNRRRIDVVKNRDGQKGRFQIHFEFEPMNFDEDEDARLEEENHEADVDRNLDRLANLRESMI
jgi:replicative DNA helicase